MSKIKNRIIKTELIDWRSLEWFQPPGLKDLDKEEAEKLSLSLEKNDFIQPFNVWKKGKKVLICDGHHRFMIMQSMEENGDFIFPDLLPANFLRIKNDDEAKKLVLLYSSQYAKFNKDSLADFIADLDLNDLTDVDIPELDLSDLIDDSSDEVGNFEEKDLSPDNVSTEHECPKCGHNW